MITFLKVGRKNSALIDFMRSERYNMVVEAVTFRSAVAVSVLVAPGRFFIYLRCRELFGNKFSVV